jgi:hypothetical protein
MADYEMVAFDEVPTPKELKTPPVGSRYIAKRASHFEMEITVDSTVDGRYLAVDGTKLDLLTVSQAVDLDTLEARVNALNAAVVLKGLWDASAATFPTSTVAGESWICSVGGTVNGVDFVANDRVVALVDGALPTVYAANWHKLDYTDSILSVAGKTGAVTLVEADISDLQPYLMPASIDTLVKLNTLVTDATLIDTNDSRLVNQVKTDGTAPLTANWDAGDFEIALGSILLKDQAVVAHAPGKIAYRAANGGGFIGYVEDMDITANFMEEEWVSIRNDTGVLIPDGTAVYISGWSGGIAQVTPLKAENGHRLIGLVTHSLEDGTVGKATRGGQLSGPDYSTYSVGDTLYVSTTVAGEVTSVPPLWPEVAIEVGTVANNSNPGTLNIDIEHHGNKNVVIKSYNFSARTATSGIYYLGGFYDAPAAAATLTQASSTQVFGSANSAVGAHAFIVFGSGGTDGTNITLTASGTSVTDAGVRTPADSEIVYTGPVAGLTLNDYLETSKKWVGAVTFTLTSDGVNFNLDFNYGWAKYEDFANINVTLRATEAVGLADASDAGFNVEVLHHKATGWTYSAAAFAPGATPLASLVGDYVTESNLTAGEGFAWKRADLVQAIDSANMEGLLMRVTTSVNNSVAYMSAHLAVVPA